MKKAPVPLLALSLALMLGHLSVRAEQRVAFKADEWVPASNEQLDSARGGFVLDTGLSVSFGIIRTVTINGNLVNRTSFDLPDITRISADQARLVNTVLGESGLVQSGSGNFIDTAAVAGLNAGTVIQNSLSDQQIQTLTVINTGVNSLGLMKSLNTQSVLRDSLLGSSRSL